MGLDTVELIMAVEEEFAISVPNEVATTLTTLGAIRDFVIQDLEAHHRPSDPGEVWERIKGVMRRDFAIPKSALVPEAHIVDDLGLD